MYRGQRGEARRKRAGLPSIFRNLRCAHMRSCETGVAEQRTARNTRPDLLIVAEKGYVMYREQRGEPRRKRVLLASFAKSLPSAGQKSGAPLIWR